MNQYPLKRGDVVALHAVVGHDLEPADTTAYVEIGYRTFSIPIADIVRVVHHKFNVGETVLIDATPLYPTKRDATVRAQFDEWVVVTVEEGMPPMIISVENVERLPPKTAEIFKALTTPVIVDPPLAPLAPEPMPMPAEDYAVPPSATDTAEAIATVGGNPSGQF